MFNVSRECPDDNAFRELAFREFSDSGIWETTLHQRLLRGTYGSLKAEATLSLRTFRSVQMRFAWATMHDLCARRSSLCQGWSSRKVAVAGHTSTSFSCWLRTFPLPVTLYRLAADFRVFILSAAT